MAAEPALKAVEQYMQSVKQYPNPPARNLEASGVAELPMAAQMPLGLIVCGGEISGDGGCSPSLRIFPRKAQ
jgi:hypothetical protein